MGVKEILSKAKKLLKVNEYIYQISETPHYYLCFIDDTKAEILDGGDIEVIIIDKANENMKRPEGIGSNMYFLPIPMDDIKSKKTIYSVDNEETEKSDRFAPKDSIGSETIKKTEKGHKFDNFDLNKFIKDPANAKYLNMVVDTNLKLEDLYKKFKTPTPPSKFVDDLNPKVWTFTDDAIYKSNCQRCVAVFEMAFRGYDVKTAPFPGDNDFYFRSGNCATFFGATKNDWEDIPGERNSQVYDNIVERFKQDGKNARYVFKLRRKDCVGHVFNIVMEDEVPVGYDAQTGERYEGKELKQYLIKQGNVPSKSQLLRVDNREIDINRIKDAIEENK